MTSEKKEVEKESQASLSHLDIFRRYATDTTREEEGTWVHWAGDLEKDGVVLELLIARADNPRVQAARERLRKPYLPQIRRGTLPDSIADRIAIDVILEGILRGWRLRYQDGREEAVMPYQGEKLPYNADNARKVLTEQKDFRADVGLVASDIEVFRLQAREEAAKN